MRLSALPAGPPAFPFPAFANPPFHVKAGIFRVLALTPPNRSAMVPDWPPIAETLPGFDDITGWIALVGPAGLPKEVADKLNTATTLALQQPEVKTKLAFFGLSPMPMTAEQLKGFIGTEIPKWTRMAREAKIQPE